MALPYKETISITLPTGFTTYSGLAVNANKIYVLAHNDSRMYILTYPLTGGTDDEDARGRITPPTYFDTSETFNLDTVGDGFCLTQYKTISALSSSFAESDFETDSTINQQLGITYDADNTRFITLARDTIGGDDKYLRFVTYGADLERVAYFNIGGQSSKLDRGMVEYSSDKVWMLYGQSGRVLSVFSTQLVASTETQPISEVPTAGNVKAIDISFWSGNLYVLADNGKIYVYGAAAPTPVTSTPTQQLFIESPYFQKFAVARTANPIVVLTFNADMLASTSTELFRYLIGGDVTLTEALKNVAIVPQFTVPNVQVGDKVFPYSETTAPTTIPTDALNVEGIQRVGEMQRQIIIVKTPTPST